MINYTDNAISKLSVRKKKSENIDAPARKSIHFRVLEETYKEIRKFSINEDITVQGLVEFFMCSLLDDEQTAKNVLKNYKQAILKNKNKMSESDIGLARMAAVPSTEISSGQLTLTFNVNMGFSIVK